MRGFPAYIKGKYDSLLQADRDARYVLLLLIYLPVLLITTIQALNRGWFDSFERPLFNAVNKLPHIFHYPFLVVTQLGSLAGVKLNQPVAQITIL